MQVFGIRHKAVKYFCFDCRRKLKARSKTPEWRSIPADSNGVEADNYDNMLDFYFLELEDDDRLKE